MMLLRVLVLLVIIGGVALVRTATLHQEAVLTYRADAHRLYDVRLMAMSALAFTLTGLERIDGAEYAQSWLIA